jgi:uncharacterized protein (DUF2336 family)
MNPKAAVILTPSDVERLLSDHSEASRIGVLEKVSQHYNSEAFAPREREIAEQIFRLLMKDAALLVRETLAERIKENADIPRDIVLQLANDVDSVSLPVLEHSTVLSDADLVTIVEASRDISKLMTISKRDGVSSRVSTALVESQYPQVVSSLLANETAKIDERALDKIVDGFRGESAVMEAMVSRHQLPMSVVERLVSEASQAVAQQLKEKYNVTDEQLRKETGGAGEDVLFRLLTRDVPEEEVVAMVAQMAQEDRLNASIVMTALCRGQSLFFATAMAQFSGVTLTATKKLLGDKGELGFKGIYDKSGLPSSMFEAVRLLWRAVQSLEGGDAVPGSLLYANRLVERVLALAGHESVEYLPYFIALIRQHIARH